MELTFMNVGDGGITSEKFSLNLHIVLIVDPRILALGLS
jgi:hypothetical protein